MAKWAVYFLVITQIIFLLRLYFLRAHWHKQKRKWLNQIEKTKEVLCASPLGYFYFLFDSNNTQVCSRRLAVLLGIYELPPSFEILLKKLSEESQKALFFKTEQLHKTGLSFSLTVMTQGENRRFTVQGSRITAASGQDIADILWFEDQTDLLSENDSLLQQITAYRMRDKLFMEALDGLPFPLWLRNWDLSMAYCNKAYLKLSGAKSRQEALSSKTELIYDSKDKMGAKLLAVAARSSGEEKSETGRFIIDKKTHLMQLHEIPLEATKTERFLLGFIEDVQQQETLKESLQNYLKAQYQVLGALSSGIVIFDAAGYVQFYNKAFCDLWKLPEEWLINAPSYAAILDKLREKRLLPEQGNFIQYKHFQLESFATLSKLEEDILYLPNGRIYKRMMNPYPLGGVVMTFDDVTDKVSLERQYNEQLTNQQSILNKMIQGLLIFNQEGRLKGYNTPYVKMFEADDDFLKSEPLLQDVLNSQKNILCSSDDVWDLLKQKILLQMETEEQLTVQLNKTQNCIIKSTHLPDGGLLITYELK